MELVKKIVKVGNSAGVILPIGWYGGEARIELIRKPISIEEDVLSLLKQYLPEITGIYLTGSYARGEQEKNSDVDIIVLSKTLQKEIFHGKYHILIYPADIIKKAIRNNPLSIYPRLIEAKPILNASLLEELKKIEIDKSKFKSFISDTDALIKINKETLVLDKLDNKISGSIIYSVILRLRGINLINCILRKKVYSNKNFKKWLSEIIGKDKVRLSYEAYSSIRDNRKVKELPEINIAEKLLSFLEEETKKLKEKI